MSNQEEELQSPEMEAKQPPKNYIPPKLLEGWTPKPSWGSTIALYLLIGLASFGYGILISYFNTSVTELVIEYDKICKGHKDCLISITVPQKMEGPVFLYYGLNNFYQNHRLYLVSRSIHQLEGQEVDEEHLKKECTTAFTNHEMETGKTNRWGKELNQSAPARPCGLIAKAFFTDTYKLYDSANNHIPIDSSDIIWPKTKFKNVENYQEVQWIDVEDEHFQVWMKTGVFADGRKLWGRIKGGLEPGDYFMKIDNTYDVEKFHGKKYIVLTTSNMFGGKVEFLASTFLVIGMIFLLVSLCFFNRSKQTKKVHFSVRGVTN